MKAFYKSRLRLRKLSRFADWWYFKLSYLFLPFYLLLPEISGGTLIGLEIFFCLLGYFICTAAFGHLVNDLGDRKSDILAGKQNGSSELSLIQVITILLALLAMSFGFLYLVGAGAVTYMLATCEALFFLLYSLRPFRLKESHLGLPVDSMYAHVLPFCITATLISPQTNASQASLLPLFGLAILWQFFSGLRGILTHEMDDMSGDQAAGTQTSVIKMGKIHAINLKKRWVLPIESTLLILAMLYLAFTYWLPLAGLGFYSIWFYRMIGRQGSTLTHNEERSDFGERFLDPFYRQVLPVLMLISLLFTELSYWPFLGIHLLLFNLRLVNRMPHALMNRKLETRGDIIDLEFESCYLTSLITSRNDVNIHVVTLLNGSEIPQDLCYQANSYSNYYAKRFAIREQPVCFNLNLSIPRANLGNRRGELVIQATMMPSDQVAILYREFLHSS